MVCPPATSEAGAKRPRSISNPNFFLKIFKY
jgi:hypothetical protein